MLLYIVLTLKVSKHVVFPSDNRIYTLKVLIYILTTIRQEMPLFIGKSTKKQEILSNLDKLFEKLHKDRDIPQGDFPEVERMRELLQNVNFNNLPKLNNDHLITINSLLRNEFTELVSEINSIE